MYDEIKIINMREFSDFHFFLEHKGNLECAMPILLLLPHEILSLEKLCELHNNTLRDVLGSDRWKKAFAMQQAEGRANTYADLLFFSCSAIYSLCLPLAQINQKWESQTVYVRPSIEDSFSRHKAGKSRVESGSCVANRIFSTGEHHLWSVSRNSPEKHSSESHWAHGSHISS